MLSRRRHTRIKGKILLLAVPEITFVPGILDIQKASAERLFYFNLYEAYSKLYMTGSFTR